jgi:hypothetical protein
LNHHTGISEKTTEESCAGCIEKPNYSGVVQLRISTIWLP